MSLSGNYLQSLFFQRAQMKSHYLYIMAGDQIDETTSFYKVSVGTTRQANRDYLFLIAYATANNHFFELWSDDTQQFYNKLCASMQVDFLPLQLIDARQLVRCLKTNTAVPLSTELLSNQSHLRLQLDTNYRLFSKLAGRR